MSVVHIVRVRQPQARRRSFANPRAFSVMLCDQRCAWEAEPGEPITCERCRLLYVEMVNREPCHRCGQDASLGGCICGLKQRETGLFLVPEQETRA
jgi:hypothetical protein